MLIKLLKDYDDFKAGEKLDTSTDEDAQRLFDEGVAEKYVPELPKVDLKAVAQEAAKEAAEAVRDELKSEIKDLRIPAVAIDENEKKKGGFDSAGEFYRSVMNGPTDQKLLAYCKSTGMNEAINADGGFLIPEEFSTALLTAIAENSVLAPKAMNFPINHNLSLPYVKRTTQALSWTGGVRIYKPGEGVSKTASQPVFAKCELKLHKMTALVYATDELLNDAPMALQTFLTTMAGTEFALTKDEDMINGSGAGEALGVLNAPATISIGKETDQPADTIVSENVLKMWSRLSNPSRSKAVWLIAQDAMTQIATLSITVGTGGAPVFLADIKNPLGANMLGAPLIWSPHCQTVGDKGDIILADFSQYVTVSKAGMGMETATSIHVKFVEDETAFRFVMRFDGQPWWSSALTPKHGSSTVSPFVTLDERP